MGLRVGISVVRPVTTTSYTLAAVDVSRIEMTVSAYADTSGLFRITFDSVVTADNTVLLLSKHIADTVGVPDTSTLSFGKVNTDAVSLSDVIQTTLIFIRSFADLAILSDDQAKSVAKSIVETVAASDALSKSFAASYANTVSVVEAASLSVAKAFTESISTADVRTLSVDKALAEALTLADSTVWSVAKVVDDAPFVVDNSAYVATKALADGVGLNELLSFNYSLAATIDNVTFTGDTAVLDFSKAAAEIVSLADAGLIVSQDYCDLTYFAEDYVGTVTYF